MIFRCFVTVLMLFSLNVGCQNGSGERTGSQVALPSDKPQLKKIRLQNESQADSLINLGLDVIVVEENYVVARLDEEGETNTL